MMSSKNLTAVAVGLALSSPFYMASAQAQTSAATTPIQHVIVIVGENHTFDNVYATYQPSNKQKIDNLLSKGIIKADGTPGANFSLAAQQQAFDIDAIP
jgi:phospholipase C